MRIEKLAKCVVDTLRQKELTLATAESCTGGGLGRAITAVPGSSAVYLGGVISYANAVKEEILGVSDETLWQYGAVSHQTAQAMAKGVRALMHADVSVSITGIAGPSSDGTDKPVGLVYICLSDEAGTVIVENHFEGGREEVREQTIEAALQALQERI